MTTNDPTLQGFWRDLERDTSDLDLWLIYCDYLEERAYPAAEVTRLWFNKRYATIDESAQARLSAGLHKGLRPLLPRRTNSIGMEFVLVPKGTFWMSKDNENARREVKVTKDFYIGIYPVMQGEWKAVMGNNPSHFSRIGDGKDKVKDIPDADLSRFPVEQVSWHDAQVFTRQLNEMEREHGWLYRLPTTIKWEYVCRGAGNSKEDCRFDFYFAESTDILTSDQANFDGFHPVRTLTPGDYLQRTTKVGSYEANVLGVFDMHGNVREWCRDRSRKWLDESSDRVIRGGSWSEFGSLCRARYSDEREPSSRSSFLGFRLILSSVGEQDS